MTDETYHGYSNRDTWLVPLWIDNDYHIYQRKVEMLLLCDDGVGSAEAFAIGAMLWIGTDTIDWDKVNWTEISDFWEAERLELLADLGSI